MGNELTGMDEDVGVTAELVFLSRALDRVEAMPVSEARTRAIRDMAVGLEALDRRASDLRKAEVLRLRQETELALAPLAELTGMSKARAGQIVKEAENARADVR